MKYKIVSHDTNSNPQIMEQMLENLNADGWHLVHVVSAEAGRIWSIHTNESQIKREFGPLE